MNFDKVLRSLGSGVIVYVIVAACSSNTSERASSPIFAFEDARPPVRDHFVPIKDAFAQADACGACAPGAKQQVVGADSDPAQQVGGFVQGGSGSQIELTAGPAFVTDLRAAGSTWNSDGTWLLYTVPTTQSCASTPVSSGSLFASIGMAYAGSSGASGQGSIHGGRMFVSAGERLCVSVASSTAAGIRWSGFRPY